VSWTNLPSRHKITVVRSNALSSLFILTSSYTCWSMCLLTLVHLTIDTTQNVLLNTLPPPFSDSFLQFVNFSLTHTAMATLNYDSSINFTNIHTVWPQTVLLVTDCCSLVSSVSIAATPNVITTQITGRFKKMDTISYGYISGTIYHIWMIYITFERGCSKV
jgi:hypothetical protein